MQKILCGIWEKLFHSHLKVDYRDALFHLDDIGNG